MEQLKKLFSSKTRYGRVVRTFIQAFIGMSAGIAVILAVPEVGGWFATLPIVGQVGGVAGVIAIVTTVQNYFEKLWDSVEDW